MSLRSTQIPLDKWRSPSLLEVARHLLSDRKRGSETVLL